MAEIEIYPGVEPLAQAVAEKIVSLASAAIMMRGKFSIALSGGKTPPPLYRLLATGPFLKRIDWKHVHVFWSDERCVPPDHPDSNYRMARETLLDRVPLPSGNIYRMRGELKPSAAATDYEQTLRLFFDQQITFDLHLLGIGTDGHTASLYPGTTALKEEKRWVVANYVEKLNTWRITMSPLALNAAASVIFMVSGQNKAEALREILEGSGNPLQFPAKLIQPQTALWMIDEQAASLLSSQPPGSRRS